MKELDFDELDKAVNAIIDQRQAQDNTQTAAGANSDEMPAHPKKSESTGSRTSGYIGNSTAPSSYASNHSNDDDDDETSSSLLLGDDAAAQDDTSTTVDEEQTSDDDDTASSNQPTKPRKRRRFMDVKPAVSVRGMKVIQPLSANELAKQGMGPASNKPASPQLDYTVTSKPFFDIKPVRQKKASDVTFLIDREESTSELMATDSETKSNDEDTYTAPEEKVEPVVSDTFDIDSAPAAVAPASEALVEPTPEEDDTTIDPDEFRDTLEDLEVKTLDAPVADTTPVATETEVAFTDDTGESPDLAAGANSDAILPFDDDKTPPVIVSPPLDTTVRPDQPSPGEPAAVPPLTDVDAPQEDNALENPVMPGGATASSPETMEPALPAVEVSTAEPEPVGAVDETATLSPMTSPFLPDAKIEKRPLGSLAAPDSETSSRDTPPSPQSPSQAKITRHELVIDAPAAVDPPEALSTTLSPEVVDSPEHSPEAKPDESIAKQPVATDEYSEDLPAEYQSGLLELEGDSTGRAFDDTTNDDTTSGQKSTSEEKSHDDTSATSDQVTAIGSQQIPRQYSEKKSEEVTSAPIYETESYKQPMATAAKQKSGWWVVVIVCAVILLGGGGGALLYLMQTGAL